VRILYFADIRFPLERANGIQTMETCYALAERGHTVDLVVRPDTQVPQRDPFEYYGLAKHDRLVVERAPVSGPALARRVGYLAFAVGRTAGSGRADIVLTRDLAVASLLVRLPTRPPLVYESHGYAPDVAAALPELVSTARAPSRSKLDRLARREAHVWRHADGYITITGALKAELTTRFGARGCLAVVHDGARIPADQQDHETRIPADQSTRHALHSDTGHSGTEHPATPALCIGYAGHLYGWKGVDVLLEAIARVPAVRGLIVGGHEKEPDLARLEALASRLGIASRVTFTGHVAPRAVPAMLARADILALPNSASAISTRSTSPLKLFEYMTAGRSIVSSDLPAVREVLQHEVNGWLVAPGDPEALASGIRRLAGDPALRARLASAARESAAEYSWGRRAERLETLFADVLSVACR